MHTTNHWGIEMRTTNEQTISRLYTAGMNLAQQLRMSGLSDEAHQIEVWVLSLVEDLKEKAK